MKRLGLLVFCVASCSLAARADQFDRVEQLGAECRAGKAASCRKLALLAKSDSGVTDPDAVRELSLCGRSCQPLLADVAKNAKNFGARSAAVRCLQDQSLLADIAKNDEVEHTRTIAVRRRAWLVERLPDQALLAQVAKSTSDPLLVRLAAVRKLADEALLAEIARTDTDWRIRRAAVENSNLKDQAALAEVARTDREGFVRGAVLMRLTDQTVAQATFAHVAKNDSHNEVRKAAAERLTDQAVLADIARTHKSDETRLAAAENLADRALAQATYAGIARNPDNDWSIHAWSIRMNAVERLTDQAVLADIAKNATGNYQPFKLDELQGAAASRLTDQALLADVAKTGVVSSLDALTDQSLLADVARNGPWTARRAAVEWLTDLKVLADLAEHDDTAEVRAAAKKKLADPHRAPVTYAGLAEITSTARQQAELSGQPPAVAQKVEPVVQLGHAHQLVAIAVSPDGALLATGSGRLVKLWELASGRLRRTIAVEAGEVRSLSFHPDNRRLAVGGGANEVLVFDVATGDGVRTWQAPTEVQYLAFSPDGRWLFLWGGDQDLDGKNLRVWSVETWELVQTPPPTPVKGLRGARVVTLPGSGTYIVVCRQSYGMRRLHVWPLNADAVPASFDGEVIAAGGGALVGLRDGEWWCLVVTGNGDSVIATAPRNYCGNVRQAELSPDGRRLARIDHDKAVSIFNLATGKEERFVLRGAAKQRDGQVFWTGDGRGIVTYYEGHVETLDAETGRQLHDFSPRAAPVTTLKMSGDGRWLAVAHGTTAAESRAVVSLWDLRDGALLRRVDLDENRFPIGALAFDRAGATLFAGSERAVFAVEINGGRPESKLTDSKYSLRMSHAPSADLLAVGWGEVFDLRTRGLVVEVPAGADTLALSPDGRLLATAASGHLSLWETMTGRLLFRPKSNVSVERLAFSPDGRWLASASQSGVEVKVEIWNPATGNVHRTMRIDSKSVHGLTFSPDSPVVTVATMDPNDSRPGARIQSFDVQTGERKLDVSTGQGSVAALEASPDGRWLLSAEEAGAVHLWDAKTGAEKALLLAMPGTGDWAVVAPDGFFDGSAAGIQRLAWRFGGVQTAPVEAFFNEFYRPGLLAEILAGRNPPAPADIGSLDRRQASVRISVAEAKPAQAATAAAAKTTVVRVEVAEAPADAAHAAGSGARDVRLFRNGSLVRVWRGDVLARGARSVLLEARIPLVAGENRLTAYAFNRANIKSADATLTLTGDESLRRKGTLYVVGIGIDVYANPEYKLRFAVADATAFAGELKVKQLELSSYERVVVVPVFDQEATKASILAVIRRLAGATAMPSGLPRSAEEIEPVRPEDAVVLFFAGHGVASGNRFYLLPHDLGYEGQRTALTPETLQSILAHGISDLELEGALEAMDARQIVLVVDACNSGQALEAEEKRRGPMNSKGLAQLAWEKGMVILTAAQSYQAALETAHLGHGYLTYALVEEGLKSPAPDAAPTDGIVTLREWFDYAASRVPQMQFEEMRAARAQKRALAFVEGEEAIPEIERRSLQRPRVFHRREADVVPMVIRRLETAR